MKYIIVLFLSVKIVTSFDLTNPLNENKYFEIIPDRIECILESSETGYWHLKVRKVNKTRAIFGYISILEPMGNDVQLDAKALKKQGGEYRYLPYRLPQLPLCSFCAEDVYIYQQFAKDSDLPADIENHCPLEPKNYTFNGAIFNPQRIPSNALQSENYFEVIIDRIEIIKEVPGFAEWHLKVRKVNKTRLIFGYITLNSDFGNDLMVEFKCVKKQGGEYRYLPYSIPKQRYCDYTKTDNFFYPDLANDSDFPTPSEIECPIGLKRGNYSVNGVTLSLGNIPRNFLHSGEYGVDKIVYFKEEIVGYYKVYSYVNSI